MPIATNPTTGEVVYLDQEGSWQEAPTAINPQTQEMLAYDGRDWKPVPASKGVFSYIDDAVRSIANGATFGFMDEIAAKADEVTGRGGSYEQNLARERSRDADIPIAIQIPGEIAGAIGTTVLAAPLAAWRGFAAIVSKVPEWARFAALGGVEGALAGAGGATEGQRLQGAATGAAIGAPVGAAASTVVRGVERVVSGVMSAITPRAGASADIGRAIVRDDTTPEALMSKVAAAQADRPGIATLADVGGENVKGLVERVAQTPGAGRTQVIPALTQRQQNQASRITEDLRSLTGTARTAKQAIDETITERTTAAKPLYEEAFGFDAKTSPEIVDVFKGAISTGYGKAILKSEGLKNAIQTEYGIEKLSDAPLMVLIDAWKRQADDLAGAAVRKGEPNTARIISKMRDDVVSIVDKANPKYAAARNAWAGPSKFMDAIEEGRNILSTKVDADGYAARFAKLTDAEKEGQRIGAISSIVSKMGNDGAKLADVTKYLRSPEMRAKIATIMPTPESAAAWSRRLEFEVAASEMTGRSLGNSATARRLAERQDANGIVGDLVMDAMLSGPASVSFLRNILTAGPRWLRDTLRSRTDKELADILTNPARAKDIPAILKKAASQQRTSGPARTVGAAAATAGTVNVLE